MQSQTAYPGQPGKAQAAYRAQSFQAKAISLEKAAEAQTLQAQAVVHAQAQADAQTKAQQFVDQANQHAQAHAQASLRAESLQRMACSVSMHVSVVLQCAWCRYQYCCKLQAADKHCSYCRKCVQLSYLYGAVHTLRWIIIAAGPDRMPLATGLHI